MTNLFDKWMYNILSVFKDYYFEEILDFACLSVILIVKIIRISDAFNVVFCVYFFFRYILGFDVSECS